MFGDKGVKEIPHLRILFLSSFCLWWILFLCCYALFNNTLFDARGQYLVSVCGVILRIGDDGVLGDGLNHDTQQIVTYDIGVRDQGAAPYCTAYVSFSSSEKSLNVP